MRKALCHQGLCLLPHCLSFRTSYCSSWTLRPLCLVSQYISVHRVVFLTALGMNYTFKWSINELNLGLCVSVKLSPGTRASEWSSLISCCSSVSSSVMMSSRTTSTCAPSSPGVTWPLIPICPGHVPPATSPLTNQSAKTRMQEAVLKSRQVAYLFFSQSVIELVAFNLTLILLILGYWYVRVNGDGSQLER